MKTLYIGNLSFEAKDDELAAVFAKFGKLARAVVVRERDGRRSRGFGFVEFDDERDARRALVQLTDQPVTVRGRPLRVSAARNGQPTGRQRADERPASSLASRG